MPGATINLGEPSGQSLVGGTWKFARGFVPGEPNEGLVAQREGSPARLADYDDSSWEVCHDLTARISTGFTFVWYRINVTIPDMVDGHTTRGTWVDFETCIDDYGEIWIDGECHRDRGMIQGYNVPHRILITENASPGERHTIAMLAVNGPLAVPFGTVFVRYASLAFEWEG